MDCKYNIAILYGGYSNESDVSYKSGKEVYKNLDRIKFSIFLIEVKKDGWYYVTPECKTPIDKNDFSLNVHNKKIKLDFCFIALHGTPGEDGKIQGYLDLLGVPYFSVNAIEAAVTFNKRYTVAIASYYNIHVAKHVFLLKDEPFKIAFLKEKLTLPAFVKPCKSGSSLGISLVKVWNELEPAIKKAFAEDDELIIEEKIDGRVYTIGAFKLQGMIYVAPPLECKLLDDQKDFFDYETKTTDNDYSTLSIQTLSPNQHKNVVEFAEKVFRIFGNRGIMRIDAILREDTSYLLEINTIPGLTQTSAFPVMIAAMGWDLGAFYERLILDKINNTFKLL